MRLAFILGLLQAARLVFAEQGKGQGNGIFQSPEDAAPRPNIIFLMVDDWGAGDVDMCPEDVPLEECPFRVTDRARRAHLHTPRIRKMAQEGQILSNFYSPRAICTPSRAGVLSGRDPGRYGMTSNSLRIILSSSSRGGMPTSEKSVAKYLKELGYKTGYTGKWHLGATNGTDDAAYTPINHGFDYVKFFIEGSNGEQCQEGALNEPGDNNIYHMCSFDHIQNCDSNTKTCEVVEQPIRWENVTNRHLSVFKDFIDTHKDDEAPFFYYHAFTSVHVPWVPSRFFVSDPQMKYWTDFVNEMDWAVGYMLQYLEASGLGNNTMVVLTSDNGPYKESASSYCPSNCKWDTPAAQKAPDYHKEKGCSPCDKSISSLAAPTNSGGKGNTWEGGQHVPAVVWWKGTIPAGSINPIVSSGLDILPTFVSIAGGELDDGVAYDGNDISHSLLDVNVKPSDEPEGEFVYWCGLFINAVRLGRYKVIYRSQNFVGKSEQYTTPPNLCGQTGDCCPNSPSRLCLCVEPFVTEHNPPVVVDLLVNPKEDFDLALNGNKGNNPDGGKAKQLIKQANKIRKDRLSSTLIDRGVPSEFWDPNDNDQMTEILGQIINYPQTDWCQTLPFELSPFFCNGTDDGRWEFIDAFKPTSCGDKNIPEVCQKVILPGASESFFPFQNCSIGPSYQAPECAVRLPCCKQDGYEGPFEFIKPLSDDPNGWSGETERCGCFDNGPNSYFPDDDDMKKSVCDWQKDVYEYLSETKQLYFFEGFCKPDFCSGEDYDKVKNNQKLCDEVKDSLISVPSGYMFNEPYPDTQFDASLRYLNQPDEPDLDAKPGEAVDAPISKSTNLESDMEVVKQQSGGADLQASGLFFILGLLSIAFNFEV